MLRVAGIAKCYNPGTARALQVLDDVNLDVADGEFVVLLGGNGSGKSTLLKIIAGELNSDEGSIWVDDVNVSRWPAYRRANRVAYVQQARDANLAENLTVAETFLLAFNRDMPWRTVLLARRWKERLRDTLHSAKPGLEERLDDQVRSLSGGEHQIVTMLVAREIVRSAGTHGGLILLDEHISYLDPAMTTIVLALTEQLCRADGLSILMVTHNIQVASDYGDRIVVLKDRRLVHDARYDKTPRQPEDLLRLLA